MVFLIQKPGAQRRRFSAITCSVNRLLWVPGVLQGTGLDLGQFATVFQPGLNGCALLLTYRATCSQADQAEFFAANIVQAVRVHSLYKERNQEGIDSFFRKAFLELQIELKPQFLKLVNTQLLTQTTGAVGSHGKSSKVNAGRILSANEWHCLFALWPSSALVAAKACPLSTKNSPNEAEATLHYVEHGTLDNAVRDGGQYQVTGFTIWLVLCDASLLEK